MLHRPRKLDGQLLFFLAEPRPSKRAIKWTEPRNILIQLRLYRWCHGEGFRQQVLKTDLMNELFGDTKTINTHAVGRIIRDCVEYETHMQTNPTKACKESRMWWKFHHPMDLAWGLEARMSLWLREFNKLVMNDGTIDDWQAEFQSLIDQSPEDDIEFFAAPARDNKFHVKIDKLTDTVYQF